MRGAIGTRVIASIGSHHLLLYEKKKQQGKGFGVGLILHSYKLIAPR